MSAQTCVTRCGPSVTQPTEARCRGRLLGAGRRPCRSVAQPGLACDSLRASRRTGDSSRPPPCRCLAPGHRVPASRRSGTACCAPRHRAGAVRTPGRSDRPAAHRRREPRAGVSRAEDPAGERSVRPAVRTTCPAPGRCARPAGDARSESPTALADGDVRTCGPASAGCIGDAPEAPTRRPDHLDRWRLAVESVQAMQPRGRLEPSDESAAGCVGGDPRFLLGRHRQAGEHEDARQPFANELQVDEPMDVAGREPDAGGLGTGERAVLRGPELSSGAIGVGTPARASE